MLRENGLLRYVLERRMLGERQVGKPFKRERMISDLKEAISDPKEGQVIWRKEKRE